MNTERDKFLTEAMGECWHEYETRDIFIDSFFGSHLYNFCTKCNITDKDAKPYTNFSTWDSFGKLYSWCKEQEWWTMFCYYRFGDGNYIGYKVFEFIDPDKFANTVYEFLKDNP